MVNQEHPEQNASVPQAPADAPVFTGAARRRFTKVGAAAVGAVLTLKSQPGMATGTSNCIFATPSAAGSFSINKSRAPKVASCGAKKLDYWQNVNNKSRWPRQPSNTSKYMWECTFEKVFACGGSSQFYGKTLWTVINYTGGGAQEVARYMIAAYLNAMKGYTSSFLTTADVVKMWNGYNSVAGFKPAGKVWASSDFPKYIKGTWGESSLWA